jgi:hypothetical protein
MTTTFPFLIQGKNITVVIGSKSHTISSTHLAYERVKAAIKNNDWDLVKDIIEPKKMVLNYGAGNISIKGETLYWKGEEMHNAISRQVIKMLQEDFPVEPLVAFMENLMQNPARHAVDELYTFLERGNLPITSDGHFLAYKKVRDDYKDCHSNTVLNKPAYALTKEEAAALPARVKNGVTVAVVGGETVVSMERNRVDDQANNTCSTGLHFCSKEYLNHFGGARTVILKINPRDVVSIPADYNATKGRTCRYTVIGELGVDPDEAFTAAVQETANGVVEPTAPAQEYDSRGRPLSMTKDAIRKRLQRRNG